MSLPRSSVHSHKSYVRHRVWDRPSLPPLSAFSLAAGDMWSEEVPSPHLVLTKALEAVLFNKNIVCAMYVI